jgi:hypothetical protein
MSTTVSLPRRSSTSRRTQILASASALVAAASVAVTLAVAGGNDGQAPAAQTSAPPATAQPNTATQYRNESAVPSGPERQAGVSSADRFHHFR